MMVMRFTIALLACLAIVAAWESVQTTLTEQRSDFTATLVNGNIYLSGGCSALFQYYDSTNQPTGCTNVTDRFTQWNTDTSAKTDLTALPIARYRHAAASVGKYLYLIGGYDKTETLISQVDRFDTELKTWSQSTPLSTAFQRSDMTAFVIGSTIYVAGGYSAVYNTLDTVLTLDTSEASPAWNDSAAAPLIAHRGDACSVEIDGEGYVFGGFSERNWCEPLTSLEKYNPTTNEWVKESPDNLSNNRGDKACVVLNSKLYVIGGEQKNDATNCNSFSYAVDDVEVYDPATNQWSATTPLVKPTFRFPAASDGQNTIYMFGGQHNLTMDSSKYAHPITSEVYSLTVQDPTGSPTASSATTNLCVSALLLALLLALFA